jgi:hypothetical protein
LSAFLSYLASVGGPVTILGILFVSYLFITAVPWMLAAVIATLTGDKKRSKQCRKVLELLRGNGPWWWPGGPKAPQ